MSKTPNQSSGYYAIRKGEAGIENCIFLDWKDCQKFVGTEAAEFRVFDSFQEAEHYLRSAPNTTASTGVATAAAKSGAVVGNDDVDLLASIASVVEKGDTSLESVIREAAVDQPNKTRSPGKKKRPRQEDDNSQQGLARAHKSHKQQKQAHTVKQKPPKTIDEGWRESFASLKAYMESHDGGWEIGDDDTEHAKLRHWVSEQQIEYRRLNNDQGSLMCEEKIQLLLSIGFEFAHVPWEGRLSQLMAYKSVHGNLNIPGNHPQLGTWCRSIRRQWKQLEDGATETRDLDADRMQQLKELGFDPALQRQQQWDAKWEVMFAKLTEHKRKYGNCRVSRSEETQELHNWVVYQRRDYKKLKEGKTSQLTVAQIMRLNEVGFVFNERGKYRSFNESVDLLVQFKKEHGHLKVPLDHPVLGEFASRLRGDIRKRLNGEKSQMSDERFRILTDIGFNTEVGEKRTLKMQRKTWDERFEDLLAFKKEFGHLLVTKDSQFTPGLGTWVKQQRKQYRLMNEGKKSYMTAQKALKLVNIGFAFRVKNPGSNEDGPLESVNI